MRGWIAGRNLADAMIQHLQARDRMKPIPPWRPAGGKSEEAQSEPRIARMPRMGCARRLYGPIMSCC